VAEIMAEPEGGQSIYTFMLIFCILVFRCDILVLDVSPPLLVLRFTL
jgi:hypothetical protein